MYLLSVRYCYNLIHGKVAASYWREPASLNVVQDTKKGLEEPCSPLNDVSETKSALI